LIDGIPYTNNFPAPLFLPQSTVPVLATPFPHLDVADDVLYEVCLMLPEREILRILLPYLAFELLGLGVLGP
jgi:hypothetical protein